MDDSAAWLRLATAPGLGPVGQRRLLQAFGDPLAVCAASPAALRGVIGLQADSLAGPEAVERALAASAWLAEPGHELVTLADADYPQALLQLADPPCVLFVVGDRRVLAQRALAIVGSRSASVGGEQTAERFARALAEAGWLVVSGLALGIDGAAHRGALAGGRTVAVMGTGPDRIYPSRQRELAHGIVSRGALVTEFPPGTPPQAGNFPRRNRLIAALAEGVLVVEAALESGSLITARLAGDLGREVFAVPGSIHSPLARGCHRLIREGAKLVETVQDVLDELAPARSCAGTTGGAPAAPLPAGADVVLAALGHDPCPLDVVCERSGLPGDRVLAVLLELELAGAVAALAGGRYQRLG